MPFDPKTSRYSSLLFKKRRWFLHNKNLAEIVNLLVIKIKIFTIFVQNVSI